MVIVDPEEHWQRASRNKLNKIRGITTHSIRLSVPKYLDNWITQNTTYEKVVQKTLQEKEKEASFTPSPVSIKLNDADFKYLTAKSEELDMPRSTLTRYLIHKYYKEYLRKPQRVKKFKTRHSSNTLLYTTVYNEIQAAMSERQQLWHYCIRSYSPEDEEFLTAWYDRKKVLINIPENDFQDLKEMGVVNTLVIEKARDLYAEVH